MDVQRGLRGYFVEFNAVQARVVGSVEASWRAARRSTARQFSPPMGEPSRWPTSSAIHVSSRDDEVGAVGGDSADVLHVVLRREASDDEHGVYACIVSE